MAATFLYAEGLIDEDDLVAVTSEFEKKAPIFPYWKYEWFNLNAMNEDECNSEFRFGKGDIPNPSSVRASTET